MNAPKHATEADCSSPELEAEVDEAIRMCGGDVRAALRATLVANAYLDAEIERLTEAVSTGFRTHAQAATACEKLECD